MDERLLRITSAIPIVAAFVQRGFSEEECIDKTMSLITKLTQRIDENL